MDAARTIKTKFNRLGGNAMVEGIITLLITVCVLAIVVYLVIWVLIPEKVVQILWVIVVLIVILLLWRLISQHGGLRLSLAEYLPMIFNG